MSYNDIYMRESDSCAVIALGPKRGDRSINRNCLSFHRVSGNLAVCFVSGFANRLYSCYGVRFVQILWPQGLKKGLELGCTILCYSRHGLRASGAYLLSRLSQPIQKSLRKRCMG